MPENAENKSEGPDKPGGKADTTNNQEYIADFMLQEYQNHQQWALRNEELGEKRLDFFVAVITALVAVFSLMVKDILVGNSEIGVLFICGFAAVLLFGVLTLKRIISRNVSTSRELRAIGRIRKYFADIDPESAEKYLTYLPCDDQPVRKLKWHDLVSVGNAGLAETVASINSLITGGLCALLVMAYYALVASAIWWNVVVLVFIVGCIAAWIIQFTYVKNFYQQMAPKKEDSRYPDKTETEVALIIVSKDPEKVIKEIASLTKIPPWYLLPHRDTLTIHDRYFDTWDNAMQTRNLALRIRQYGKDYRLTLKGPSRLASGGAMERYEMEVPWSEPEVSNVLAELARRGIQRLPSLDFRSSSPLDTMEHLGLHIVQDRVSERNVRDIICRPPFLNWFFCKIPHLNKFLCRKEGKKILAELAIDSLVYHFDDRKIRLYELEIEVKAENCSKVMKHVKNYLLTKFDEDLQQWDHSKIATGKSIENLLGKEAFRNLLDNNGNLKCGAFPIIDHHIRQSST